MYNLRPVASKPDDWTHEQFIEWWRGEHAEVTYPLPGLRRWHAHRLLDAHRGALPGLGRHLDPQLRRPGGPRCRPRQRRVEGGLAHVGKMRGRRIAVMGEERIMFDEKVMGATR